MKIIDIGICIDNVDPKGVGRIRYRPYDLYVSELESSIKYEKWDENDPFIAIPFLPLVINMIPQIRQSVKLLKYDTEKSTQNVEYVSGPYSSPHDNLSETFLSQHKNTTYGGNSVKDLPDVINKKYIDKTKDTQPKNNDYGIQGNYGADIIFTENGLIFRGGKLINKTTKNKQLKDLITKIPVISQKISSIFLKKFPKTKKFIKTETTVETPKVSTVKYLIEYDIDNFITPTKLSVSLYKLKTKFRSDEFNLLTKLGLSDVILIGTIDVDITSYSSAGSELRMILYNFSQYGTTVFSTTSLTLDIFPFYFRPSERVILNNENSQEKNIFLESITINNSDSGFSLIFSKNNPNPPTTISSITEKNFSVINEDEEQTFGAVVTDKLFLLSTDVGSPKDKPSVNFKKLNKYELTQEDYLSEIEPYTYSLVRGEVLVDLLKLITEMLFNHVHNLNDSAIYNQGVEEKIKEHIKNLKKDLINTSIKIN